jgi:capsular polysaccharide transport system ATP-binding protein
MIEIRKLTKSYRVKGGRHYVFRGVDAVFPEGANIGIIGPNGGGKSTLLRILGGIDFPDTGEIRSDKTFSWPLGLKGGFVGHLSGRENCRMVCNLYGLHPRDTKRKLDEIKELSGIGAFFEEPVKVYSSGMGGRLGFALSMSFDFDYFLIDEITAVGDAQFKVLAKHALEEKAKRSRVIMVSHNMGDIKKFCDVGVVLKDGRFTVCDDLDAAIRAYLPQTNEGAEDLTELLREASLEELAIDAVALPEDLRATMLEIRHRLSSVEAKLEQPHYAIQGSEAEFFSLLGVAYQQLGSHTKAEEMHRRALAENDYTLRSHHALSNLASRRSDQRQEEKSIAEAERVDPGNLHSTFIRTRILLRQNRPAEAAALLETPLKRHPKHPNIWSEYAKALHLAERVSEAITAQIKGIQHAEENPAFTANLAGFYAQLSQQLAAAGAIEESIRAAHKSHLAPRPPPVERYSQALNTLRQLDELIQV